MRVAAENNVTILGQDSFESKGRIYYNVDVYCEDGGLYRCGCTLEVYQRIASVNKPATIKNPLFDIRQQYQGQSRIDLLGWS